MAKDLSILIPARNEQFLARTVEDILAHIEADTEVLVGLDGQWADPPIKDDPRVTVLYYPTSIGQRGMTNQLCKLSKAKYVMKVDAHCAFDQGFDRKLLEVIEGHDDWTLIPTMKNLHAFDRVCTVCGKREYQGPTQQCCGNDMIKEMVWKPRRGTSNNFFRFDNTLHFQYWKEFEQREEAQVDPAPTMSIQGSCFMLTREKYWELDISSEEFASWGQQGVEVACKTWLSGGAVMSTKKTWYAHMFRTQGGDFGFPYPNPGSEIEKNRKLSRDLFVNNKWPKAIHPFQWLLDKFAPIPDWDLSRGVLYYTGNYNPEDVTQRCREQLRDAAGTKRIVSVSLKPLDFGDNITLPLEKGYITMTKQILAGLKELKTDVVFFAEDDVMYHKSHFDFVPPRKDRYYYNVNVWKVRKSDGHAVRTKDCRQLSGICAYRETLLSHYEKRLEMLEAKKAACTDEEFNRYVREMGFEPGTHNRAERVDDLGSDTWESKEPNVDIRHENNLTPTRWDPSQFRNKKYTEGWQEADVIPGWGKFREFFYGTPKI